MMDLAPSITIDLQLRLESAREAARTRYVVAGDEDLAEYHYQSRTSPLNETATINYKCTPSVFRYYNQPRDDGSDLRVDISPMRSAILALNGEDERKLGYLFSPTTGIFNEQGYPKQAYITMSGNELRGEFIGDWFKFETLLPRPDIRWMTHETHPHVVHKFDLVCWDRERERTYHRDNTPQGVIYYYLVTKEGHAWIPKRYVKQV